MKARVDMFVRSVSSAVKSLFKSTCARRSDHMNSVVEALMRLYTERPELVEPYLKQTRGRS